MVLCVVAGCVVMASSAMPELIISFDEANPPFSLASRGTVKGLYPAIISEAFSRLAEPVTMQALPWKRIIAGADEGHWGVGGIYMNEERLRKYDYSEPIFEDAIKIYVLREKEFRFAAVPDMTGMTVGVMRGWSYGRSFDLAVAKGKIIKSECKNDQTNIHLLLLGRLDAILMASETWAMLREHDPENRIVELPVPLIVNKTYLIFPKSMQKAELLTRFNSEIRTMRQEGSIESIARSHLK